MSSGFRRSREHIRSSPGFFFAEIPGSNGDFFVIQMDLEVLKRGYPQIIQIWIISVLGPENLADADALFMSPPE